MKKRIKAILLVALSAITILLCSSCGKQEEESRYKIVDVKMTTTMNEGEHIISVPITTKGDIRSKYVQYDAHPGYKAVGIGVTAYGNYFGDAVIAYQNTEKVTCSSVLVDQGGNYQFLDFGTPVDGVKEEEKTSRSKIFDVGEHIISVPVTRFEDNMAITFPSYEGYEVAGIAKTSYGKTSKYDSGGVILYTNTVPVKCVYMEEGFTSFGLPVEQGTTLSLSQE